MKTIFIFIKRVKYLCDKTMNQNRQVCRKKVIFQYHLEDLSKLRAVLCSASCTVKFKKAASKNICHFFSKIKLFCKCTK